MCGFGVKSILRRHIVTGDCWFQNSSEICEYILSRCYSRISYVNLDSMEVDEKRSNKKGFKGCMTQHIFEYLPHSKKVYSIEYLCKCNECVNLNFTHLT